MSTHDRQPPPPRAGGRLDNTETDAKDLAVQVRQQGQTCNACYEESERDQLHAMLYQS